MHNRRMTLPQPPGRDDIQVTPVGRPDTVNFPNTLQKEKKNQILIIRTVQSDNNQRYYTTKRLIRYNLDQTNLVNKFYGFREIFLAGYSG